MSAAKANLETLPRSLQALLALAFLALAVFPFVGTEFYAQMVARMMILAIFAMSLDLLLGVNVKLIHAIVFALGVGLASIAGMIAAPISSVYPNMGSQVLIMCFVVVVIGGIGSVRGALISALLVGLVDTFGKVLLPSIAGMLVYMLMAAVLLWKPEGLFQK